MRVLFADDQMPDDAIPDEQIFDVARAAYPKAQDGFIRGFEFMRRAHRAVNEDNEVTLARRLADAVSLVRTQEFDVAIIDLGWWGDPAVSQADRPTAGWKIAAALDEADRGRPHRAPTAQVIYSARFGKQPQLGQLAASKGRLPLIKPYDEKFTIPLESLEQTEENTNRIEAACQSLRATLSFIEHVRATAGPQDALNRDLDVLRATVRRGVEEALQREKRWDLLTRVLLTVGVLIVLAGIVGMFVFGVPQGAVTAAVGVVVGLIPRLMFGQLEKARAEIRAATDDLMKLVERTRAASGVVEP